MRQTCLYLLFLILSFSAGGLLIAQAPVYQIQGPHTDYEGAYYIRIFVNYVQTPADQWTQNVDLTARTEGILVKLNSVYNQHNIFFVGESAPCSAPYQIITESNYSVSHLHANALDIFDKGGTSAPLGFAYAVPNTYCEVSGSYGSIPASHSEIIIHEVGHCLGLSHIFTGSDSGECMETGGLCPNGESDCYCCGDYVCDTPVSPQNITVSSDCSQSTSPAGLPSEVFRNYMSYAEPGGCRDMFTEG